MEVKEKINPSFLSLNTSNYENVSFCSTGLSNMRENENPFSSSDRMQQARLDSVLYPTLNDTGSHFISPSSFLIRKYKHNEETYEYKNTNPRCRISKSHSEPDFYSSNYNSRPVQNKLKTKKCIRSNTICTARRERMSVQASLHAQNSLETEKDSFNIINLNSSPKPYQETWL